METLPLAKAVLCGSSEQRLCSRPYSRNTSTRDESSLMNSFILVFCFVSFLFFSIVTLRDVAYARFLMFAFDPAADSERIGGPPEVDRDTIRGNVHVVEIDDTAEDDGQVDDEVQIVSTCFVSYGLRPHPAVSG